MDGVSAAASILAIATAGIQVSIKLATLSSQISTASDRVSAIGNDISLTSGVLQELGELVKQDAGNVKNHVFSQGGLETIRTSAVVCERVFVEIKKEIGKASKQMSHCVRLPGGKVELSKTEMIKWPFLQPHINSLRDDLKEAKGTLMLMLQLWLLALSKRAAEYNWVSSSVTEQRDLVRAIVALKEQQTPRAPQNSSEADPGRDRSLESQDVDRTNERTSTDIDLAREKEPPLGLQDAELKHHGPADDSERTREVSPASHSSSTSQNQASTPTETEIGANAFTNGTILGSSTNRGISSSELYVFQLNVVVQDHRDVLRGDIYTVELVWQVRNMKVHHSVIQEHLAEFKNQDQSSIIQTLDTLDNHEVNILEREIVATKSRREGNLLSLVRSHRDIEHKGIVFRNLPELQFIIQRETTEDAQHGKTTRNSSIRRLVGFRGWRPLCSKKTIEESVEGMDNMDEDHFHVANRHERHPLSWSELQGRRLNLKEKRLLRPLRPTFIKVHRRYMSSETLDKYELPWEYDMDDDNYFIIKRWIPESDQDILFEHTRQLREKRQAHGPVVELKKERDQLLLVRKKASDGPLTRDRDRLLRDIRHAEHLKSKEAALYPRHNLSECESESEIAQSDGDTVPQHAAPTVAEDDEAVVDQLLKAYTTLFDNDGDQPENVSSSQRRRPSRTWLFT